MKRREDYRFEEEDEGIDLFYKDKFIRFFNDNLHSYQNQLDAEWYLDKMEIFNKIESKFIIIEHMPFEEVLRLDSTKQYDDFKLYQLTPEEASQFVDLYVDKEELPRINCITSYENDTFGIIYNTCGECFVEQFDCIEKCYLYFDKSEIEIEDLNNLRLDEIADKYAELFNNETRKELSEAELYVTSTDSLYMLDYMMSNDIVDYKQQLNNLIENIEDIHANEPRTEVNDSLYNYVESLSKLSKFLDVINPVMPYELEHILKINEQIEYISYNSRLSKDNANTLANLCYEAYLKDDNKTSYESIVSTLLDIINEVNITSDIEQYTAHDILEAYYLCEEENRNSAIALLKEYNQENETPNINKFDKGISERIKNVENKNEKSLEHHKETKSKDVER